MWLWWHKIYRPHRSKITSISRHITLYYELLPEFSKFQDLFSTWGSKNYLQVVRYIIIYRFTVYIMYIDYSQDYVNISSGTARSTV